MLKHAVLLFLMFAALGLCASEPVPSAPVAATPAAPVLALTLKPQAVSAGDDILLSDIVELPKSAEPQPAWHQTPVARAAVAGQMRILYAQEIQNALRRAGVTGTIEFSGGESRVTALAQTVPGPDIDAAVVDAVRAAFSNDSDLEVSADILSQQALSPIRPGPFELSVDVPETGLRPTTQSLRVRVTQNGRRATEAGVSVRVRVSGTVHIAADRLPAGTVLAESDLKSVRKDLSNSELSLRGDISELLGLRVKQAISNGQIVHRKLLAAPLVVKRGDAVSVVVRRGALELHCSGEARADAALNDSVRVFIPDSAADVVGRASGPREVTLDGPSLRGSR